MSTHVPGISVSVGNVMRGPWSARVLTKIVYAEFCNADVRNAVLSKVRSRNLSCHLAGKSIKVLPALSKVIHARMWALDRAEESVSKSNLSDRKTVVKVNTRHSHCITLNGEVVFEQEPELTDLGSFLGTCAALELPASRSRSWSGMRLNSQLHGGNFTATSDTVFPISFFDVFFVFYEAE